MVRVTRIWNILADGLNTDSLSLLKTLFQIIIFVLLILILILIILEHLRPFVVNVTTARRIDCKITCCF